MACEVFSSRSGPGHVMTQTPGNMYVGSLKDALDECFLISKGISLVVTTIYPFGDWPEKQRLLYRRLGLHHFHHALFDIPQQMLDFHRLNLTDVHEYLRRGHHVFVHCEKGISRSVTFCLAYLIVFEGYNAHEGLEVVRRSRPIAYPNKGFWHQLNQLCELYSYNKPEKIRVTSTRGVSRPLELTNNLSGGSGSRSPTRGHSENRSSSLRQIFSRTATRPDNWSYRPRSATPFMSRSGRDDEDELYKGARHYFSDTRRLRSFDGSFDGSFDEVTQRKRGVLV